MEFPKPARVKPKPSADTFCPIWHPPAAQVGAGFGGEDLSIVKVDGRYGFRDPLGKMVIPAIFELGKPFSEGIAAVLHHGKWGYANCLDEVVAKAIFSTALPHKHGLARVQLGPSWFFMDWYGRQVFASEVGCSARTGKPFGAEGKKKGKKARVQSTRLPGSKDLVIDWPTYREIATVVHEVKKTPVPVRPDQEETQPVPSTVRPVPPADPPAHNVQKPTPGANLGRQYHPDLDTVRTGQRPGPSLAQAIDAVAKRIEASQCDRSADRFRGERQARKLREQVKSKQVKFSRERCKHCRRPILLIQVNARRNIWNPFNDPDCTVHLCRRN